MGVETTSEKEKIKMKVALYISSLTILFLLIAIVAADYSKLWTIHNLDTFFALVFAVGCWLCNRFVINKCKLPLKGPETLVSITKADGEYLSFLTTYIIPLVCIDFQKPQNFVLLLLLLIIICVISFKTEQYYANPILAIMGYRIYCAKETKGQKRDVILISKDILDESATIKYGELDPKVWFVRESK